MNNSGNYRSRLFTLRIWIEPGAVHPDALRFKVQDLRSGEVRYFGDWPALIAYLHAVFKEGEDDALRHHFPDDSM